MSNWSDTVDLIGLEKGLDDDGFEVVSPGKPRKIYVNRKSVRSQEFHMAKQEGITLSYMFEARSNEYGGEQSLLYNGENYNVYRIYEKGEFVELIVHRKSEDHAI